MRTKHAVSAFILLASLGGCSSSNDDGGGQVDEGALDDPAVSPESSEPLAEPSEPSEPVEPSGPTESPEPAEPSESVEPSEPAEPAEPSESVEPSEPAEPAEPFESVEPSEPAEPAEPSESVEPSEPAEPVEPSESVEPSEPAKPAEPSDPSDVGLQEPPFTRVDVEITVPAYVSNQLTVDLTWGTKRVMAEWVGDEQWRATVDFPPRPAPPGNDFPENDYLLAINFRDRNGDILLGRTEERFSVRRDDAQVYTVVADDFETGRWDDDADGTGNLVELRRGTDPLAADMPVPPESVDVSDSVSVGQRTEEGTSYFEPRFLEFELPVTDRMEVVE